MNRVGLVGRFMNAAALSGNQELNLITTPFSSAVSGLAVDGEGRAYASIVQNYVAGRTLIGSQFIQLRGSAGEKSRRQTRLVQMEYLVQIYSLGRVVWVALHQVTHMRPPTPALRSLRDC
jgi:hypothetical protein